jgi:hypothetical protein
MAAPTPTTKGLTTIVWGTKPGGTNTLTGITGFIVDSYDITPTNDGPVGKIENGDGALVAKVYLDDGFSGTFTGVYDTALTYPAVGDTCIVTIPKTPSNGGAAAAGAAGVAYNCTVDSMLVPKGQRKKEAMVTVKVSYNSGVVA